LRSGPSPAPSETSESLRARLKCVELQAERIELATLEALAAMRQTRGSGHGGESLENLRVAVQHFGGSEPAAEALELIRAIEKGLTMRATFAATE
jgi:hypothetical protein